MQPEPQVDSTEGAPTDPLIIPDVDVDDIVDCILLYAPTSTPTREAYCDSLTDHFYIEIPAYCCGIRMKFLFRWSRHLDGGARALHRVQRVSRAWQRRARVVFASVAWRERQLIGTTWMADFGWRVLGFDQLPDLGGELGNSNRDAACRAWMRHTATGSIYPPAGNNTSATVTASFVAGAAYFTVCETEITSDTEDSEYDEYEEAAAWDALYRCGMHGPALDVCVAGWLYELLFVSFSALGRAVARFYGSSCLQLINYSRRAFVPVHGASSCKLIPRNARVQLHHFID